MKIDFKVKGYRQEGKMIMYKIVSVDKSLYLLDGFLTSLSAYIIHKKMEDIDTILTFKDTEKTMEDAKKILGEIWEDHPYPDDSVLVWESMETTQNNLGTLVTLVSGNEFSPRVVYSFTLEKVYIVWSTRSHDIPEVFGINLDEFADKLIWWRDYINLIEQGKVEVEVEIL